MDCCIRPHLLSGSITPPPSKSMAHRILLAQLLSGTHPKPSMNLSQDIQATLQCGEVLMNCKSGLPFLNCGESGSTLRFLIPAALALAGGGIFTGEGRLMQRPQSPYFSIFDQKGIRYTQQDHQLIVKGTLTPGVYALPGNISSQFVTGLLYALPLLSGDSTICLTTPLESAGYVEMTLAVLEKFGISITRPDIHTFLIPGRQQYKFCSLPLECDWSQASFWYAAAFLGNDVTVQGMNPNSVQGDRIVVSLMKQFIRPGEIEIDLSNIPDLLPPLAVMAAGRTGTTVFTHAGRLRLKESDRLSTVAGLLQSLGGHVSEAPEQLVVTGSSLRGGIIDGANDHRIVMAAAIAATACSEPVIIRTAEAVQKSYPAFWQDYQNLGGNIHVL